MNKKIYEYSYKLKKEKQHKDIMIFVYIILAILFLSITFTIFIFPVRQQSTSMTPNIKKQSVMMVTPLVKSPGRGDVVILKPFNREKNSILKMIAASITSFCTGRQVQILQNKDFPGTSSQIRRIIGIPGDTIYIDDFIAHVKPAGEKHFLTEYEMTNKNYNLDITFLPDNWDYTNGFSDSSKTIVLGSDEYFVLCDNRNVYDDSRIWGPVNQSFIGGKVLFCYFPFNHLKLY